MNARLEQMKANLAEFKKLSPAARRSWIQRRIERIKQRRLQRQQQLKGQ